MLRVVGSVRFMPFYDIYRKGFSGCGVNIVAMVQFFFFFVNFRPGLTKPSSVQFLNIEL